MNPDFIAEVVVSKNEGHVVQKSVGTGYPISPGRIITAAHVLLEGESDITVRFHGVKTTKPIPASVVWNGKKEADTDVVILKCGFPTGVTCHHHLTQEPVQAGGTWHSRGFGSDSMDLGQPLYAEGPFPACSSGDDLIEVQCSKRLHKPRGWAGVSGEPIFLVSPVSELGLPILAGVLVKYRDGSDPDRFLAVPLWKLLAIPKFRNAIEFDAIRQREGHLKRVVDRISNEIKQLTKDALDCLLDCFDGEPGFTHRPDECAKALVTLETSRFARRIAKAHRKISENCSESDRRRIERVQDLMLPVRYSPETLRVVAERLKSKRAVFVEGAICHRSVAEIVMAGVDSRATAFVIRDHATEAVGESSLDLPDPLPTGASNLGTATAFEFLSHLASLLPNSQRFEIARAQCDRLPRTKQGVPDYAQMLELMAREFDDELGKQSEHWERTYYCMVQRPDGTDTETQGRRDLITRAIVLINDNVRNLTFVELVLDAEIEEQERPFFDCISFRFTNRRKQM